MSFFFYAQPFLDVIPACTYPRIWPRMDWDGEQNSCSWTHHSWASLWMMIWWFRPAHEDSWNVPVLSSVCAFLQIDIYLLKKSKSIILFSESRSRHYQSSIEQTNILLRLGYKRRIWPTLTNWDNKRHMAGTTKETAPSCKTERGWHGLMGIKATCRLGIHPIGPWSTVDASAALFSILLKGWRWIVSSHERSILERILNYQGFYLTW